MVNLTSNLFQARSFAHIQFFNFVLVTKDVCQFNIFTQMQINQMIPRAIEVFQCNIITNIEMSQFIGLAMQNIKMCVFANVKVTFIEPFIPLVSYCVPILATWWWYELYSLHSLFCEFLLLRMYCYLILILSPYNGIVSLIRHVARIWEKCPCSVSLMEGYVVMCRDRADANTRARLYDQNCE